ncbi:cell surface glycoprotein 1-like isoform X1 [Anthonomus grandis grandis]|uniref:cell surface glycoprotein 1-like isoform X1 n=1 Tax=Anthonomus grandis grandis TaxID=2921223 RepID=UPI0021663DD6|nr:cell surface glycoprotein 1-like isoform X1 [Anthonomus grandis grandis]
MGGFAWVTLATNDSYSLGALVLAHSLKQAGTVHQLAVLITPGVTRAMREKLETVFNVVKEVNVLDSRDEANLKLLKRPELGVTFTKLHCWTLTEFDKCVFLDADTLVLQNADELFERDEFSAAPDVGWPDCFNSGVFVYRPSLQTYESLIQFALERGSFDGGDQGVLNLYFSDWAHKDISKHLPFIYNMCSTACYSYLPAFKQFGSNAKIMHFIGSQKPWLQYFNTETRKVQPSGDSSHLEGVLQRWWDIFCSLIHPHLSPAMQGQSQHGMSTSYIPPRYDPPPNPTASADDCESAWDPWDDYDRKIAQNAHNVQPLNTNASCVADQPQSQNYNTSPSQSNSFYQPSRHSVNYEHISKVPTPPPSPAPPQYHPPPPENYPQEKHHEQTTSHQELHHQQTSTHQETHHHNISHEEQSHHHNIFPEEVYHQPHHVHNDPPHQAPVGHTDQPYSDQTEKHESHHSYHQTNPPEESLPPCSPPPPPDQTPVLPNECNATTTASNEISVSDTIEDSNDHDDAGLAGAFSQLTLGVARTAEQDALENVLRKQAWEVGNIDYLGKDSFDNIWSKISETLSSGPAQSQSAVAVAETPAEVAPSAPAESQSQTVQQEAQPSDKTIEKIQSNLTQEQTKTPETDEPKPAQPTCPMTPKSEEQEPIVCPLVQPEVPALTTESPSPKTESPPVLTKAQTVTPEPPVSSETPKVETQEAVADPTKEPTTAVQETASLKGETEAPIEQPPASLITSLLPKEETPTDTVVPQVLTETLGTTEQAKEQVVVEKEPVPAPETPKQQPQALPEPVKEPSEAPKEQPQVLSEPVKDTEAPKEPAQVPSEPLKEPSEEQPQVLSEPAKVQPKAVSEPLAASTTEQSQFVPLAPKEEPPKPAVEPLPLAVAPPVSVEQPPKGQLAPPEEPIVATPPIPAPEVKPEAPKPEVEDVKPVAKGVSEAQAEAAAPSKEKSEESQEAAKGATPTPPPRKTDKPKKGAAKSKK